MAETEFENDIVACLDTLRNGGLILYPTDTIWGIGCDATDAEAVKKIYKLKERLTSKSMIVLVADARDINRYTSQVHPYILEYIEKADKPTTVIYEGALGLAENLTQEDGSVGIRIVQDDFCRHLIKRFRKPIVSTSANISGVEAPQCFDDVANVIRQGVDYVVKYRQADRNASTASKVIRFDASGNVIILRP